MRAKGIMYSLLLLLCCCCNSCCCLSLPAWQAAPAAAAAAPQPSGCSTLDAVRPPLQSQRPQNPAEAAAAAGQGTWPQHTRALRAGRQLLQAGGSSLPDASNPAMAQWLEDSSRYSHRYSKGCFRDFPGFIAKDITGAAACSW